MRVRTLGSFFVRSLLFFAAMPLVALAALSQTMSRPDPAQAMASDTANAPAKIEPAPAPAPKPPAGPPNLKQMSPEQIADLAAYNIKLASLAAAHYTYKETEHNQNYIDGKLVVDHTTVTENIFINNLPYMRKIMFDGKPLEGKELKAEQKLYDDAVRERRALDEAGRAGITKGALRSVSSNINRLSANFVLKLDGHQTVDGEDCVVLDAVPPDGNTDPQLAQHIRIALEADTGDVLDVSIENLEDQNGFSKGTVQHLHYKIVGGNTLLDSETFDSVVRFKELLGKPITIHRERAYSDYKRFRATVTIKSFSLDIDKDGGPDAPAQDTSNPAAAKDAAPTPQEKAKRKAEEKAKAEAAAKAKAEARAQARIKAEEDAKAKAEAKAQADAEAKAKADAAAKAEAQARAEAKAQADADAKARADERAQAKAAADAKAKAEADQRAQEKARIAALAKADAEEKARLKADLARSTAEEKAKIKAQTDAIKKNEADTRARLKEQAKEQAKLDAAARLKAKTDPESAAKAQAPPAPASAPDTPPDSPK
jgi:hypothetical protein